MAQAYGLPLVLAVALELAMGLKDQAMAMAVVMEMVTAVMVTVMAMVTGNGLSNLAASRGSSKAHWDRLFAAREFQSRRVSLAGLLAQAEN